MIRSNCVICGCSKLNEVVTFKNFPVFMGTVSDPNTQFYYEDLTLVECSQCGTVQILNLVDIELLYQANHNIEVVGDLWHRHNRSFADFILQSVHKNILEVGDPACKIASLMDHCVDSWCIIEPNASDTVLHSDKVRFIRKWFDDVDLSEFEGVDCVVLSHVFEHLYDPRSFLKKCYGISDTIVLSVPNMDEMLSFGSLPSINFEHTFFLNSGNFQTMLAGCGYYIDSYELFEKHSVFYRIKRKYNVCDKVMNIFESYREEIEMINTMLPSYENVYIYGANFPAQMLIKLGLDMLNVRGVLDNSKSKIGNYLYGTSYKVFHPSEISDKESCLVICKMGVYDNEIRENLISINRKVAIV